MLDEFLKLSLDGEITFINCLAIIGVCVVLGVLVCLFYMYNHKEKGYNQGFIITLGILPAIIAVIILLVGNSVARAFSLAGVFAIIRFRSTPGEPEDIVYILLTLAIGLASGIGYIIYAILITILLLLVLFVFKIAKIGKQKNERIQLKIIVPENLNYQHLFDDLFEKYTLSSRFVKIKTSDFGALFTITYDVILKPDINQKDFIDEIRCRNGNLAIFLTTMYDVKFGE